MSRFFEAINSGHLHLRSASALDTWVYVVGLKKEVAKANKVMKLSFFSNYDLTHEA